METRSTSGVRIAADFRDNLIIDRYDPVFATMRASKIKHLKSENSEDAVTWNVFRSLRQVEPDCWLPTLVAKGLAGLSVPCKGACISLWASVSPPVALLEEGDEGQSEVDVIIESPSWVWFIEAKYRSDISTGTTTRPNRDQILRNIDVGSYYAGVRSFHFSLLVHREASSAVGARTINRYSSLAEPRQLLSKHRPDGLANLKSVSLITWKDLEETLGTASVSASRADERGYAERALAWMVAKGL